MVVGEETLGSLCGTAVPVLSNLLARDGSSSTGWSEIGETRENNSIPERFLEMPGNTIG